jgi:hypothetical protein
MISKSPIQYQNGINIAIEIEGEMTTQIFKAVLEKVA